MGLNQCPGCGAPVNALDKICSHCGNEVIISSFQSVASLTSPLINRYVRTYEKVEDDSSSLDIAKGLCYMKLKIYDSASKCFLQAIDADMDNSQAYFLYAASLLKGKKAFLAPRVDIDTAEQYLQDAISIENKGIYYYFLAYLRYDHHFRKGYRVRPDYVEYLRLAKQNGVSLVDIKNLFLMLDVQIPNMLII